MEFLNQIYNVVRYLPVAIPTWIWVVMSMLFAGSVVYLALKRQWLGRPKRAEKPVPPAPEAAAPPADAPKEAAGSPKRPPVRPSLLQGLRQRRRFGRLFKELLQLLKREVRGRDYRYQIPWILLIGEEGAGKSSLLPHIQLNKPLGPPPPNNLGCAAWLFDKGVLLDLAGSYFMDREGGADEGGWRAFLRALRASRPRKPLEGVVLAISAEELLRYPAGADAAAAKAERIYRQLWVLQQEIGLRLPVYLLITQCDRIEGFAAFSSTIPERLHNDIFGWSNPSNLDVAYQPEDVERAFGALYRDINELQLQLTAAREDLEERDAFLIFPHRLRPLFRQLQGYLDAVFRPSVYHETYPLRGIYFCGDLLAQQAVTTVPPPATSDELGFEPKLEHQPRSRNILYLTHLFRDKVFAEIGIARPVTRSFLWEMRRLRSLQALFAATLLLLVGGQWLAYRNLTREKEEQLLPVLKRYAEDNRRIDRIRSDLSTAFRTQAAALRQAKQESAQNLLHGMERIETPAFDSLFLPPSWISLVNDRIRRGLASAYETTILNQIYVGLHFKARVLLYKSGGSGEHPSYTGVTEVPDYQTLLKILDGLEELQGFGQEYNSLAQPQNIARAISSVQRLGYYCFGVPFGGRGELHRDSLAAQAFHEVREFKPFNIDELYMEAARQRVVALNDQWLDKLFGKNLLLQRVTKVTEELNGLRTQGQDPDRLLSGLNGLQAELDSIDAALKRTEWNWVAAENLLQIPEFQRFFAKVAVTPLLGKEFSASLYEASQAKFLAFREHLLGLRSDLGGAVLQLTERPVTVPEGQAAGGLLKAVQQAAAPLGGKGVTGAVVSAPAAAETGAAIAEMEAAVGGAEATAQTAAMGEVSRQGGALAERLLGGGDAGALSLNTLPVQIKTDLADLMAQEFMRELPFNALRADLPPGTETRWEIAPLQRAVALA